MSGQNNNIPEGFKTTEIGLLPEEWETTKLGDLFEIKQGKALSPEQRRGISPRPFLRTANVFWGYLGLTTVDSMDFTDAEVAQMRLMPNDLLVCEGGDIGRTAIWKGEKDICCYQNHLHRLRTTRADVYPLFYMYWMQAAYQLLGLYGGTGNKTTIPNLSQSRLKSFLLPLPPLPEQKAIARVLSTIQKAVEAQDKIIAAARELKKSLMSHLFTYGPVPVAEAEKVALKETEIGVIPEHWETVKLGEYCNFTTGKLNSNQAIPFGKYPFFTCSQETFRIDRYSFDSEAVLLSGNNARGIYSVKYYKGKFDAYQRTYVITIQDTNSLSYLYLKNVLETKLEELRIGSIGTSTKFLTLKMLLSLQIPKPPIEQQHEIARMLSELDNKIQSEENYKAALQTLFKTMLHHLMTGKVRMKELGSI